MSKGIYLCGPMSGRPQFNFPLFDAVTLQLRLQGYDIISPTELDDPATRACSLASKDGALDAASTNGHTWGDFLSRDIKVVVDRCDSIALLDEWELSRGARLEVFAGILNKHKFYSVTKNVTDGNYSLIDYERYAVASVLRYNLL